MGVKELINANKQKLHAADALKLARAATRVFIARGKKTVEFDMRADPPDEQTLLKHMLGPTGNLRAPTIRAGNTLLVGFNAEMFESVL